MNFICILYAFYMHFLKMHAFLRKVHVLLSKMHAFLKSAYKMQIKFIYNTYQMFHKLYIFIEEKNHLFDGKN